MRDESRIEQSLQLFERLADRYDFVLVDTAGAEGLLPFGLQCRARNCLVVSSNEASSVHLLGHLVSDLSSMPGESRLNIIVNVVRKDGIGKAEIIDFLQCYPNFQEEMVVMPEVPFDSRGRHWVGTGNTFYTESSRSVRKSLQQIASIIIGDRDSTSNFHHKPKTFLRRLTTTPKFRKTRKTTLKGLPLPVVPTSRGTAHSEASRVIEPMYEPPQRCPESELQVKEDRIKAIG